MLPIYSYLYMNTWCMSYWQSSPLGIHFRPHCASPSSPPKFSTPSRKKVTPPFQILLSVFQLPSYCAIPHDPPLAPLPHKAFLLRRRNVTPSFQILPPFCRSIRSIAQLNRFLYLPFGILFHHRQMQKTARGNPLLRPYYPRLKSPRPSLNDCCALISGFLAPSQCSEYNEWEEDFWSKMPNIHNFHWRKIHKINSPAKLNDINCSPKFHKGNPCPKNSAPTWHPHRCSRLHFAELSSE